MNSVTHSFLPPAGLSQAGTNALSLLTWRTLGRCAGVWTRHRWREPVRMSTCQATGHSGLHGYWGAGGGAQEEAVSVKQWGERLALGLAEFGSPQLLVPGAWPG